MCFLTIKTMIKGKEAVFGSGLVIVCDIFFLPKAAFVKAIQRYCDKPGTV